MVTGLTVAMWIAPPHLAIFPPRSSAGVQTCSEYSTNAHTFPTVAPVVCLNPGSEVCLGDRRPENAFKNVAEVPALLVFCFFFFLQLALYPVNSALLVDSAHPSFCVPSSFHWLDLRRLFEGNPNGFRQLLELVWTPEALTKSTLFPSPHGDGKWCNKQ